MGKYREAAEERTVLERIRSYMKEQHMVEPGDIIVVGVSGGADSVCLLTALRELKGEFACSLAGVHVNHGLRGAEAERDEEFVKKLCEDLGIPCFCYFYEVQKRAQMERLSLEEAGRLCRYEAFERAAQEVGGTKIAVAHHRNDQAETLLFQLFRGSGLRGLAGMEPVRGRVIRPLLCVERAEIEAWLSSRGLSWCTDSTNGELLYSRNKLRGQVIPYVERELNAGAVRHMAQAAEELLETEQYLSRETGRVLADCVRCQETGCLILSEPFKVLEPLIKKRVLRTCLAELGGGLKDVERGHILLLLELFSGRTGSGLDLPGGVRAVRTYEGVELSRKSCGRPDEAEAFALAVEIPGSFGTSLGKWVFSLENAEKYQGIPEKTYTKWFDYDKIKGCLMIRTRRPGDTLEINRDHGRKKLKSYLIDEKIPREQRAGLLLLAEGSDILWVPGLRISEKYKVTAGTKTVLKVQIQEEESDG